MMYTVHKINKRIYVMDEDAQLPVFTAPDWLRPKVPDRAAYQFLADQINSGVHYADAVLDFYRTWNTDK